ncbi:MAG TPA: hypothetical protein PKM73_01995 [Verrucomicrobiota bacterium]|nr:hypothetical protein [Verrucomicrobiota bacterium]HNU50323.1 hypothetical protein [Verrucomicrobiota bacterium]
MPAFAAQTPGTPPAGDSSKIIALPSPAVEHPQLGEALKALRVPKKTHAEAISLWLTDLEQQAKGWEPGVLWAVWLAAKHEPRLGSSQTAQHLTARNERLLGMVEDRLKGCFSRLACADLEAFLTGARTFEALVTEIIPVRWFDPLRLELEKALEQRLALLAEQAQVLESCRRAVAELHHRLAPRLLRAPPAGTRAGQDARCKMYVWLPSIVLDVDSEAEIEDWIRSAFETGGDGGSPTRGRRGQRDDSTSWAVAKVPVPVARFRGLTVADLVLLARVTLRSLLEANKITESTLGRRFHIEGEAGEMLFRAVARAVLQSTYVSPQAYIYFLLRSALRESRNAALGVSRHMQEVLKQHAEDEGEPCNPKSVKKALQAQALACPLSLEQIAEEDPAALDRISSRLATQPSLMASDELEAASCLLRRSLAEAGLKLGKLARGLELLWLHLGRGQTFAGIAAVGRFGKTEESVKKLCARFVQTVAGCRSLSGHEKAAVRAILESDWLSAMLQDKGWEWLLPSSPPAPGQHLKSK